jgi:hypothetical protein
MYLILKRKRGQSDILNLKINKRVLCVAGLRVELVAGILILPDLFMESVLASGLDLGVRGRGVS